MMYIAYIRYPAADLNLFGFKGCTEQQARRKAIKDALVVERDVSECSLLEAKNNLRNETQLISIRIVG